jgi:hypothetical protein
MPRTLAVLISALTLLVSCYWQAPVQSGSLSLAFPDRALSRDVDPAADTARIYLEAGGAYVRFGPPAHPLYDETAFSAGSVYTSPPIPAGAGYTVMVAVGEKDAAGFFTTMNYGIRDEVSVSTGASTGLSMTLSHNPFLLTSLWGANVTGVLGLDYVLYAGTEHDFYSTQYNWNSGAIDPFALLGTLAKHSIGSLSPGAEWLPAGYYSPTPWLDTDQGIVPYRIQGRGLDLAFASGAGLRAIRRSAGFIDPGTPSTQVPVYIRGSGIGGVSAPNGVPGTWADTELSQKQGGAPAFDLVSTYGFAYLAADSGALRVPASAVHAGMTPQSLASSSDSFDAGVNAPVLSLAAASDGGNYTILYMGTSNGAYAAVLDEQSPQVTGLPWGPLSGTAGKRINEIRAYEYRDYTQSHDGSFTFLALRTDTDILILEVDNSTGASRSLITLTVPSGLPADVPDDLHGFSWYDANSGDIYLAVSGRKGLVMYLAGTYNAG